MTIESRNGMRRSRFGVMSTQIAVRLPDEAVCFLDAAVASGATSSRAALITAALEREMRRQAALADVEILRREGVADDLDELVEWTVSHVELED